MVRSQLRFLGLAFIALMVVAACGSTTSGGGTTPTIKVGLVTDTGGLNDKSFNHLAALGLAKASTSGNICSVGGLQCSNGFNVKGDVIESKTGDEYVPNLRTAQVLFFKEQESGALVAAIAALLEKGSKAPKTTHVISAVGAISIPPVNHYIAGYKWAAKMIDPTIKVYVGYSNDFNDPAKCKSVANSQIGQQHSEFVFQVAGGCGLGALQAAGLAKG